MGKEKPPNRTTGGALRLAGAGMELAGTIVVAFLLGYWIDLRFGTDPWGKVILALIGVVGGLYNLIRQAVHEMFQPPDRTKSARESGDPGHSEDHRGQTES